MQKGMIGVSGCVCANSTDLSHPWTAPRGHGNATRAPLERCCAAESSAWRVLLKNLVVSVTEQVAGSLPCAASALTLGDMLHMVAAHLLPSQTTVPDDEP